MSKIEEVQATVKNTPGLGKKMAKYGAIGAVVLVDTERLDQCFPAVDYFESRQIPFVVAVNCFDGVARHDLAAVRDALSVPEHVPMLYTDARSRGATKHALITLVQHAMSRLSAPA